MDSCKALDLKPDVFVDLTCGSSLIFVSFSCVELIFPVLSSFEKIADYVFKYKIVDLVNGLTKGKNNAVAALIDGECRSIGLEAEKVGFEELFKKGVSVLNRKLSHGGVKINDGAFGGEFYNELKILPVAEGAEVVLIEFKVLNSSFLTKLSEPSVDDVNIVHGPHNSNAALMNRQGLLDILPSDAADVVALFDRF